MSGTSITTKCSHTSAVRFERKILVVDTPGIFDTKQSNHNIQREILKCMSITSPGPHAFILVLSISRHTEEEQKSIQHFVDSFGVNIFKYFIILFTKKDDLDIDKKSLEDYIEDAPQNLKAVIKKCGGRVIAFNNRLEGEASDLQVESLLIMISNNVRNNNDDYYTNEMIIAAEKVLREREAEIVKEAEKKREQELKEIEKKLKEKFIKEAEKHRNDANEEWFENYCKVQAAERNALKRDAEMVFAIEKERARDEVRKEVEQEKSILGRVWGFAKLILPGAFSLF